MALCFCCVEIQGGLIGVGLINVEDRPGILTLDKGSFSDDEEHLRARLVCVLMKWTHSCQTTTTSGSSSIVFWEWQYSSRTLCSNTFPTRWQQSSRKPRRMADSTWAFWVNLPSSFWYILIIYMYNTHESFNWQIISNHPKDLGSGDEKVKKVDVRKFLTPGYTTSGHVELYTVSVHEKKSSWFLTSLTDDCCWCVCFPTRWVWSGGCPGRKRHIVGPIRVDQMMVSTSR